MSEVYADSHVRLFRGDALEVLGTLEAGSVQCVVTSPPFWGLRDYNVAGQLGLEGTPELYVQKLVEVFREVRRVLRDDGTVWVNLGDSYASGFTGRNDTDRETPCGRGGSFRGGERRALDINSGLKPKDLVGIPWRVAFALQADGWYLRSDIVWSKPNPMPESVTDRPTKAHEYVFLLSKKERYYYDQEAVREPLTPETVRTSQYRLILAGTKGVDGSRNDGASLDRFAPVNGRNLRSVWTADEPLVRLRTDLSEADRSYVLGELLRRGL